MNCYYTHNKPPFRLSSEYLYKKQILKDVAADTQVTWLLLEPGTLSSDMEADLYEPFIKSTHIKSLSLGSGCSLEIIPLVRHKSEIIVNMRLNAEFLENVCEAIYPTIKHLTLGRQSMIFYNASQNQYMLKCLSVVNSLYINIVTVDDKFSILDAIASNSTLKDLSMATYKCSDITNIIDRNTNLEKISIKCSTINNDFCKIVHERSNLKNIEIDCWTCSIRDIASLLNNPLTSLNIKTFRDDIVDKDNSNTLINSLNHSTTLLHVSISHSSIFYNLAKPILDRNAKLRLCSTLSNVLEFTLIFHTLPPYIILELFDWWYVHTHPDINHFRKIDLVYKILNSIRTLSKV